MNSHPGVTRANSSASAARMWLAPGLISLLILAGLAGAAAPGTWPAVAESESLSQLPPPQSLQTTPFADWTVLWNPALEIPALGFGPPLELDAQGDAESALSLVLTACGCHAELQAVETRTVCGLTRTYFRELREGLPVLGGRADVVLNARGRLARWNLRVHSTWPISERHLLGEHAAALALAERLEPADWRSERTVTAWYPDHGLRALRAVYFLRLAAERPDERWEGIVDAASGEVILDWPGIRSDVLSGVIQGAYWPMYDRDTTQVGVHPFESLEMNSSALTTDAQGQFSGEVGDSASLFTQLRGPYVLVLNDDGDNGELGLALSAPYSPLTWEWTTADAVPPELNLFHHTMLMHQWYKALDPQYTALDYPLPAVANYGSGYDNAFWNGYGTYYGAGSQYHNFAMFSDVIYHEYTHGVTDGIYPDDMLPYIDQPGALDEAWSDYFACTINGDPYCAEYIGGGFHTYFRNLNNDLVYPRDWAGEVHADSRFVSGALWRIRTALGTTLTDSLAHFSRYALTETFLDYLVAVLETDDDDSDLSNGTPHGAVIYHSFGVHGIGPGDDPHFAVHNLHYYADGSGGSVGDGDRFIEPGETAELVFELANDAVLYPPPATNVQITVSTGDSTVSVENGQQAVAELAAGQSVSMSPVLLRVSASAPDHWAVIHVNVTANGGSATFEHVFEFTVGTPRILVVKDDAATNVESYVPAALRAQDRIYDPVELAAGQSLPLSYLPQPGVVIWLSGDAEGTILTTLDRAHIESYLAGGNRVVLSGQNIADALDGTDFALNVLEVEIETDSLNSYAVLATAEPLTPDEWFLITGFGGAANQREQTSFTPLGASAEVARYGRNGDGPVAAVKFAGGRGLLFGFGLEAISGLGPGSTDLQGMLDRICVWAQDVLASVPRTAADGVPMTWHIGPAYPNPFNATTTIAYAIPTTRGAELVIYDLLGRLVELRQITARAGAVHWGPDAPSGIYFARIRWEGGETQPVRLLLLK